MEENKLFLHNDNGFIMTTAKNKKIHLEENKLFIGNNYYKSLYNFFTKEPINNLTAKIIETKENENIWKIN